MLVVIVASCVVPLSLQVPFPVLAPPPVAKVGSDYDDEETNSTDDAYNGQISAKKVIERKDRPPTIAAVFFDTPSPLPLAELDFGAFGNASGFPVESWYLHLQRLERSLLGKIPTPDGLSITVVKLFFAQQLHHTSARYRLSSTWSRTVTL